MRSAGCQVYKRMSFISIHWEVAIDYKGVEQIQKAQQLSNSKVIGHMGEGHQLLGQKLLTIWVQVIQQTDGCQAYQRAIIEKQRIVLTSTTKAKYLVLGHAIREAV